MSDSQEDIRLDELAQKRYGKKHSELNTFESINVLAESIKIKKAQVQSEKKTDFIDYLINQKLKGKLTPEQSGRLNRLAVDFAKGKVKIMADDIGKMPSDESLYLMKAIIFVIQYEREKEKENEDKKS